MTAVAARPSTSVTPPSASHAPRQPSCPISSAVGSGSTMPAVESPIVEIASARPRRRTNQRATVVSPVSSPSATLPKAITRP